MTRKSVLVLCFVFSTILVGCGNISNEENLNSLIETSSQESNLAQESFVDNSGGSVEAEEVCDEEHCSDANRELPFADEDSEMNADTEFNAELDAEQAFDSEPASIESPTSGAPSYKIPPYQSAWGLSKHLYDRAVNFYQSRAASFSNKRFLTIVDFSHHSSRRRFFLFDLATGNVSRHLVSHGKNSDRNNDGIATDFSNATNSNKSSLGFYQTLGTYRGSNGYSLRLRGLESTNSNAERRAIVIHPARYVNEAKGKAGRSWGCPALDPKVAASIINRIKGGSILLIGR